MAGCLAEQRAKGFDFGVRGASAASRGGGIAHRADIPPSSTESEGAASDASSNAGIDTDLSSEINRDFRFVVSGLKVVNSKHDQQDGNYTNPDKTDCPMQGLHGMNHKLPMTVRRSGYFVNENSLRNAGITIDRVLRHVCVSTMLCSRASAWQCDRENRTCRLAAGGKSDARLVDEAALTIDAGAARLRLYFKALNPAHCSAPGGIVVPLVFRSTRITFLSVEQNRRLPVRSNTSGAAPVT